MIISGILKFIKKYLHKNLLISLVLILLRFEIIRPNNLNKISDL